MEYILCSGGIGDALLGVAKSFELGKPLLIHAANRHNREIIEKFLAPFDIPTLVLDGSFMQELKAAYPAFKNSPACLSTCHLPDDMNYAEWANRLKYEPRVPTRLDVQELFGKVSPNPKPTIVIAPAGSNLPPKIGTPYGEFTKNRVLKSEETVALAHRYLKTHRVALVGNHEHEGLVRRVNNPNCFWASADYLLDHKGRRTPSTIGYLYSLINSAEHVYSVDTWVKTYSCFAEVPTTVIRTRYNGIYPDMQLDLSENVFLNRNLWNLDIKTIEELTC
jgi:hypothetical protein